MLAHIAGIPVEELLPWIIPGGGIGLAGAVAWGRTQLGHRGRR